MRVGTSGDYAPFSHWPEDESEPSGFSIDLARAFAAADGRTVEWVRFAWPDLLRDLARDRFDFALSGVTIRPERSVAGLFGIPVTTSGAVVLVRATGPWSTTHSAAQLDVPGIRLAVNAGGHLERVARSLFGKASIEAVANNDAVLETLARGEVDAIVTDTLEAPHWRTRLPGLRTIGPLTQDRKAALFPPDRASLARRFDAWLLEAEAMGELARLRLRHGLPPDRTADPGAALLASLDERLSLMPAVAEAKRTLGIPIEDRAREERVLDAAVRSVARAAAAAGREPPDERAVRRLFLTQMESAKWIQARTLEAPTQGVPEEHARESARRALDHALRPALIRLGDRIVWLLVAWQARPEPPLDASSVSRALADQALPARLIERFDADLRALRRGAAAGASNLPLPAEGSDTAPSD